MMQGSQTLKVVADYVAWLSRVEALEAARIEIHGRLMAEQQMALEMAIDHRDLEEAKIELKDLDLKLEAAGGKLKFLYDSALDAAGGENEARYRAGPEIQDSLDQEYQRKCEQAAVHLVQVMSILEDLAIHPVNLVKILGIEAGGPLFASKNEVFSEAYNQAKRPPLTPKDSEWANTHRQRQSDLTIFLSNWAFNRISVNHRTVDAAIMAAGGQPPRPKPFHGEREEAYAKM